MKREYILTRKIRRNIYSLGVFHINDSFKDILIHLTDFSGSEKYAQATGNMKLKVNREVSSPYSQ
jgi:ribosomal protein S11